jgi:hypothetical protein
LFNGLEDQDETSDEESEETNSNMILYRAAIVPTHSYNSARIAQN